MLALPPQEHMQQIHEQLGIEVDREFHDGHSDHAAGTQHPL